MELIGALMHEHRLIERIIRLIHIEHQRINRGDEPDIDFIDNAIDFIHTYADLVHHGKEEDILFKKLEEKPIIPEHREIMNGLIADHNLSRNIINELIKGKTSYAPGDREAANELSTNLNRLVNLYPAHIEREDKQFFFPSLEYFTREERSLMLQQGMEFDRQFIHDKYRRLIEELEKPER
jgi:hemerythrin-like domain-containing protein